MKIKPQHIFGSIILLFILLHEGCDSKKCKQGIHKQDDVNNCVSIKYTDTNDTI